MTRRSHFLLALLVLVAAACVPSAARVEGGRPVADPAGLAQALQSETLPAGPLQVNFDWELNEAGSRVRGRGVVRLEAPRRIRLDLFGQRGDTYLSAALVGEEYRFPNQAPPPVELPSPALLWGALGIFQPPPTATLQGAVTDSVRTDLEYTAASGDQWVFHFRETADGPRLTGIEREANRGLVESVTLEPGTSGTSIARYRDWSNFRDLTLTVSEIRSTAAFPPDIWTPGASSF